MYKLYQHAGSGGFAVEAALALAGQAYENVDVDTKKGEQFSDAFRKINPWTQVPALTLPDGTLMTESAAMVAHIAATFPKPGLSPAPGTSGYARLMRWLVFMTINIYECDLRYYYSDRYTTDEAGRSGVKTSAVDHMQRGLQTMEDLLTSDGPYVLGTEFSVADPYLAMVHIWYPGDTRYPAIEALHDQVKAHPVVGPLWTAHFDGRTFA